MKKTGLILLLLIFALGLGLRIWSVYPANIIVGFDQARDLFDATTIFKDWNLRVIGPTAGNNPNLHHGIMFLYYLIPPLALFGPSPIWAVFWNSLFNTEAAIVLYFFAKSIFNNTLPAYVSAFLVSVSYLFIQYSGWLSNPTVTLPTVPVFFWGLWEYFRGKKWGLPLSTAFLGASIQFELFFVYLIPIGIIAWFILKPKLPSLKLALISLLVMAASLSTMIATEVKFHFAGILSFFKAGAFVGGSETDLASRLENFLNPFWKSFAYVLWPTKGEAGIFLGFFLILFIIYKIVAKKENVLTKKGLAFILLYLLSPAMMLILGSHNAPWFLVGLPPAIALAAGYIVSQIKFRFLILVLLAAITGSNIAAVRASLGKGQVTLEPDPSSILSSQLAVIDYTYQSSQGKPFVVDSVTNPLYVNAVWAYDYKWYGEKKYGYLPFWAGGDQLPPYDTLPTSKGGEEYLFLLIDDTPRIPEVHKILARQWADKRTKLIEEKTFGGITVQKRWKK